MVYKNIESLNLKDIQYNIKVLVKELKKVHYINLNNLDNQFIKTLYNFVDIKVAELCNDNYNFANIDNIFSFLDPLYIYIYMIFRHINYNYYNYKDDYKKSFESYIIGQMSKYFCDNIPNDYNDDFRNTILNKFTNTFSGIFSKSILLNQIEKELLGEMDNINLVKFLLNIKKNDDDDKYLYYNLWSNFRKNKFSQYYTDLAMALWIKNGCKVYNLIDDHNYTYIKYLIPKEILDIENSENNYESDY